MCVDHINWRVFIFYSMSFMDKDLREYVGPTWPCVGLHLLWKFLILAIEFTPFRLLLYPATLKNQLGARKNYGFANMFCIFLGFIQIYKLLSLSAGFHCWVLASYIGFVLDYLYWVCWSWLFKCHLFVETSKGIHCIPIRAVDFFYAEPTEGRRVIAGVLVDRGTSHLVYKAFCDFVRDYANILPLGSVLRWDLKRDIGCLSFVCSVQWWRYLIFPLHLGAELVFLQSIGHVSVIFVGVGRCWFVMGAPGPKFIGPMVRFTVVFVSFLLLYVLQ